MKPTATLMSKRKRKANDYVIVMVNATFRSCYRCTSLTTQVYNICFESEVTIRASMATSFFSKDRASKVHDLILSVYCKHHGMPRGSALNKLSLLETHSKSMWKSKQVLLLKKVSCEAPQSKCHVHLT